jgi:hypothetical protein
MAKPKHSQVVVGNIGTVYSGYNGADARIKYGQYVKLSKLGVGRAGGEQVTMFTDGEIVYEHNPPCQSAYAKFNKANLLAWLDSQADAIGMQYGFTTNNGYAQVEKRPTEVQVQYGAWRTYRLISNNIRAGVMPNVNAQKNEPE